MAIFRDVPASQSPESSLRLPAQKRITPAAAQRLSTITETGNAGAHASQPRGILRTTPSSLSAIRPGTLRQHSGGVTRNSQDTQRTGPPAYEWIPEPIQPGEDGRVPVEGEKVAQLRREGVSRRRRAARGGWGRIALILGVLALLAVGLGVGLGVGLSRHKNHSTAQTATPTQPAGTTPETGQVQAFPLGEYSLITALRTINTNCTSNPVTWRCYPYTTYSSSDSSTNTSSLATFNWIISNTSTTYATNTIATTSEQGVPANLTVSSTDNPFSISVLDQPLTYISSSSNTTSARYTFGFTMSKADYPSSPITSNNAVAECFFNQTIFSATLYLDAPFTFPSEDLAAMSGLGGYTPWPYAVEITQSSPGGQDVPACYETINGVVGDRIVNGLNPEPASSSCSCDYRNY